jgi:hypothetical protein
MSEQEWNDYINEMFNLDKEEQKKEQKPIMVVYVTQIIFSQQIGVFELSLS